MFFESLLIQIRLGFFFLTGNSFLDLEGSFTLRWSWQPIKMSSIALELTALTFKLVVVGAHKNSDVLFPQFRA